MGVEVLGSMTTAACDTAEEWGDIPGYVGLYQMSRTGIVRRIASGMGTYSGRLLKHTMSGSGYLMVGLSRDRKCKLHSVHRLVAMTFLPVPPSGHTTVRHLDDNKMNNCVGNLAWGTDKMNKADALRNGRCPMGERHWNAKLGAEDIQAIRRLHKEQMTTAEIARRFAVKPVTIGAIVHGRIWDHVDIDNIEALSSTASREAMGYWYGNTKLTIDKVRDIRRLHAAGGIDGKELGAMFGVTGATIGHIVSRKTWRHVV